MIRFLMLCLLAVSLAACSTAPDRQALYVSCNQGASVLVYEIDDETGELTAVQTLEMAGPVGPLALTDDGQTLYAAIRNPARVVPMTRDTETGELTALQPAEVPDFPTYLDIDATGRFALTASYGPGTVHSFRINDDLTVDGSPLQTTQTARTAHACLIDPTNRFVYIPHTEPNVIFQFAFDAESDRLSPLDPLSIAGGGHFEALAGPRHYAYHPTLDAVYFVNELNSSVSPCVMDRSTGTLQRFDELSTLPDTWRGGRNTCADIHITPDGRFLYASNRGHNSIVAFRIGDDGMLSLIDWFETEEVPREFEIDLTGRFLYSAGLRTHKLDAFAIDADTGRLTRIATYDTPEGPIWVTAAELD